MHSEPLIEFANQLAEKARETALKYFRQPLEVHSKSDNTPVSVADKEIELRLRRAIGSIYPEHGILGEEYEQQSSSSEYLWVIDPIDGTKSFITGHPTFGSLIALLKNEQPVLGIIEMPALKERWIGIDGKQTMFNGQHVHSASTADIHHAVTACTAIDFFQNQELPLFDRISKMSQFRIFGGDCYNYGLLSSGYVDIVMEADLKPFDFMALIPVIKGSGGQVSDWQGSELTLSSNGQILASANSMLHSRCLAEINRAALSSDSDHGPGS